MRVIRWQKCTHELSASFLEKYQGTLRLQKKKLKKNDDWSTLVERWSIEGCVTKVVEWIVVSVSLLILHKTKVLIL